MAAEFLKAIEPEAEEFMYNLPALLEEAAKKHQDVEILAKNISVSQQSIQDFYKLEGKCVKVYRKDFNPVNWGDPDRDPYLDPKERYQKSLTYKKFVKGLSLEDMVLVSQKLIELGIK